MSEIDPVHGVLDFGSERIENLYLEEFKLESKEMAEQEATLICLGNLRGETPASDWTGKISLSKRLKNGEITEAEVDEATSKLNESFVAVGIGAPKRCVDGSTIAGYDDKDPKWYGRPLGPQVQGGTIGGASGSRLAKGYQAGATLLDDVKASINTDSRFAPGDHTDNHSTGNATGCGQIDGQERRSVIFTNERFQTVARLLKGVYEKIDADFPQEKVKELEINGRSLNKHRDDYYSNGYEILNLLTEANANAIEKLIRPHAEVSLTINFVDDTTFHRDHYNARSNSAIQNFNLDAWNIIEEHADDAFFVLADAVATLMDLTDGSLLFYLRLPKQAVGVEV